MVRKLKQIINTADLDWYQYYEKENILQVCYKGGSVINYHPVNPETFAEQMRQESLDRVIKNTIHSGKVVGVRQLQGVTND